MTMRTLPTASRRIGLGLVLLVFCSPIIIAAIAAKKDQTFSQIKGATERKMNIQEVTSPGGIKAWLVEDHSVPLVAVRFAFQGGANQDPDSREGVANFLSSMLDEGAGDMNAQAYQERMEDLAMRMSFDVGRDYFYGSFTTLSENREAAIDMLKLALTKPRFDKDAIERMRKQITTSLAFAKRDPGRVAGKAWNAAAFPGSPYGRPSSGTLKSVAEISGKDLEAYRKKVFARGKLKVAVVGDISAKDLGKMLDKIFGDLPAKPKLTTVAKVKPKTGGIQNVIEMNVPQSVARFGFGAMVRKDPDFVIAYVLNHIIGGGGFSSRLMEEVREKRGLAYSVYSYLQPFRYTAVFAGGVATKNDKIAQSLDVIKSELKRIAKDGPSAEELKDSKNYLTGSYALRFDTSAKIANQLLGIQQEDLGLDYVNKRNKLIEAVTLDDIKRVARKLLKTDDLIVIIVGKPKGLKSKG